MLPELRCVVRPGLTLTGVFPVYQSEGGAAAVGSFFMSRRGVWGPSLYVPSAGEYRQSDWVNVTKHWMKRNTNQTSYWGESCHSFRLDDTRTELLPELVELAGDEESSVRLAAFDTIINLMEMMDSGESSGRTVVNKRNLSLRFPQNVRTHVLKAWHTRPIFAS